MDSTEPTTGSRALIDRDALIATLSGRGYEVIGPQVRDAAVVYEPMESADALPWGWVDEQDGGHYRLTRDASGAAFAHVVGPQSWKKYLYPPRQTLWKGRRDGRRFTIEPAAGEPPRYAFLGVRGCELAAIAVQDRVFGVTPHDGRSVGEQSFTDTGYAARRKAAFLVAVNCGRAGGTCFCASMGAGPKAEAGYDLALTELIGDGRHVFLIEAGTERGAAVMAALPRRPATDADQAEADAAVEPAPTWAAPWWRGWPISWPATWSTRAGPRWRTAACPAPTARWSARPAFAPRWRTRRT